MSRGVEIRSPYILIGAAGQQRVEQPACMNQDEDPMHDLVIRGGTVITADRIRESDVGISGQRIEQIGGAMSGRSELDASGKLVLPGAIDAHVHLTPTEDMLSGPRWCDDFASGSRAAAAGGVTTVGNMTFPRGAETMVQAIDRETAEAAEKSIVDVILHPVFTRPMFQPLDDLEILASRGVTTLKYFTSFGGFTVNPDPYLTAMERAKAFGILTLIHCEDSVILQRSLDRLVESNRTDIKHYPESRPREAEIAATARAAAFAENTGAPTYIVHLSCEGALDEVNRARRQGAPLWVETRPLYLYLSSERFAEPDGAKYVGQPPLREPSDIEALWNGLANGEINTVCTDHAAWKFADKVFPGVDIATIRPGVADLETLLPMLWSTGVNGGRISSIRFVQLVSTNAAKLFGLYPRKGTIEEGSDADIVIWDPDETRTVRAGSSLSTSDFSPYEGWQVTGWPKVTISRGEIIFDGERILAEPGRGRVLERLSFCSLRDS